MIYVNLDSTSNRKTKLFQLQKHLQHFVYFNTVPKLELKGWKRRQNLWTMSFYRGENLTKESPWLTSKTPCTYYGLLHCLGSLAHPTYSLDIYLYLRRILLCNFFLEPQTLHVSLFFLFLALLEIKNSTFIYYIYWNISGRECLIFWNHFELPRIYNLIFLYVLLNLIAT